MDRTREARRSAMAASNGLSRRRQRSSGMDDGQVEMQQEGLRLRDRPEKKDRDRDSSNWSKRRRSERFAQRNERDVEEDSSDESLGDDDVLVSQNSTSFQQNYLRKSFPPTRLPRHAAAVAATGMGPSLKVADEMIGVSVPRKARSACVKRSHDCRTSSGSGGGGFGEDHRIAPASPASHSFEAVSPSSSNVSVKQKTKPNGSKTRVPKPPKSSGAAEDDLEIEIAEVLSGLKKQPRSSKKEDDSENSLKSAEFKASKKMKPEGDVSSALVENGSITSTVRAETGFAVNMEISMAKPEKSFGFNPESRRTAGTEAVEAAVDMQNEALKQEKPEGVENKERFDLQDSTVTKGASEGPESKSQREESNTNKFEIDLMVPPPMPSSPERDSLLPLASDMKPIAQDHDKRESLVKDKERVIVKKETASEDVKEKKVENREWLKLDLEKPSQDNVRDSSLRLQNSGQSQEQLAKSAQQSSVLPLPIAVGGWPNGIPPLGYIPPFQTTKPVEGITGSSPTVQAAPFGASQPKPKRCATHYFIARNIHLHQQFVKTNQLWPTNTGSVPLNGGGSRPNNLFVIPPTAAEGLIHGNPSLHGSFPVLNLNSLARDKGRIVANVPTQKDKASESGNLAETTQKKLQPPTASSNLLPAPAFIFPISHHQQPVIGTANQSAPSKSVTPAKNLSLAGGSTSVSFSYPSSSASEVSPYFTIVPNNGYTFQVSSSPAVRGGTPGQALPFFNGSLYSPQMFQPSQLQQKQGQAHKETGTSSGSSSSHKQPHSQVGGNSLLNSANVQKHLPSTAHQSQKLETKTSGENSSVASDSRGSHSQKSAYVQNMTVPLQPLNFSMSFASFSGSGTPSNLNFSSNGYHIVPAPQAGQQKNHQVTDSKTGGSSINLEDPKRAILGKPPAITNGQTLVFDNSARTLSFVSGSWPPRAVTTTAINSNPPASTGLPNSQQFQIQKHHMPQQQQQYGRSKLMATNTLPATSLGSKFPNSISVFPQTHALVNPVPAKSAQWRSPATSSSLASCSSLNLKQFQSQQQIRTQGQTQISFAGTPKPVLVQPSQGQQEKPSSSHPQSQPSLVAGSSPNGKTNSTGSNKTGSPLVPATVAQPQQAENSAGGSNPKSSPVCGRNVPSIISSCTGHLSELKY